MKSYKFSPIENEEQLLEAIKYTHFQCFSLCKNNFGRYLPVAGNIGIFCHYDDEYEFLTKLKKELTEESDNWNHKYYRLRKPIIISAYGDITTTTYTYLYIRKPEDQRHEVGDVDFVLNNKEYLDLKNSLLGGKKIRGVEILDRLDLDLIKLSDPDIDTISFIGTEYMSGNMKIQTE